MKLWDRIKKKIIKNAVKNLSLEEFEKGYIDKAQEGKPQNLSGVYACIEIISNTIAKLPFFIMDRNTKEHIKDDNLYWLLNYMPNKYMNAFTFKKYVARSVLCTGNGYIYPLRDGLKIDQFIPIPSNNVTPVKKGNEVYYVVNLDAKNFILRYDELIHIKEYTDEEGIEGISILTFAKNTVDVGLNQEKFQKTFYKKNGRPSGTLEIPTDISLKKLEIPKSDGTTETVSYRKFIIDNFESGQDGDGNFFRTALLDNGIKYTTIPQISPADMDFVNSKTVNLEDIARFFNVPAYKLGVGKQTYSNNEQAEIDYITNCIVPKITQWEQEFTIKSLPISKQKEGQIIKANIEAELRGDTGARANWYEKMQSMGVYDIDDIRDKENLPDLPDGLGKVRLIGPNSIPLERLVKGDTANVEKTNSEESNAEQNNADENQ